MESLGMSPGALPWRGGRSGFPVGISFSWYWAYSSKSTVWPKMETCFQDGACSVCFLHSALLMLLTHSMSITHRDILHPGFWLPIWENDTNLWVTKFITHCKMQGLQSRTIKTTITMVNTVFHQSPSIQDRTKVQKGMFSFDIAFTWFSYHLKQLIHCQINQEYIYNIQPWL